MLKRWLETTAGIIAAAVCFGSIILLLICSFMVHPPRLLAQFCKWFVVVCFGAGFVCWLSGFVWSLLTEGWRLFTEGEHMEDARPEDHGLTQEQLDILGPDVVAAIAAVVAHSRAQQQTVRCVVEMPQAPVPVARSQAPLWTQRIVGVVGAGILLYYAAAKLDDEVHTWYSILVCILVGLYVFRPAPQAKK